MQRLFFGIAAVFVAISGVSGNLRAQADFKPKIELKLEYKDITQQQADTLLAQATAGLAQVMTYLGKQKLEGRIIIRVADSYTIPYSKWDQPRGNRVNGEILIPGNRVRGDVRGGPQRDWGRGPAIVHEIAHIVAPSGRRDRYLDEGLGVFIQEKFSPKGDKSYPNMGYDVHEETARALNELGKIIAMSELETERNARTFGPGRKVAYLQEGSFVRYLIESNGIEKFMQMYEGGSYEAAYGKAATSIYDEWIAFIRPMMGKFRY